MNKTRREELRKAIALLEEAKSQLEYVSEAEQETYDNMPEGLQESNRALDMLDNVDVMVESIDAIDDMITNIQDVIDK